MSKRVRWIDGPTRQQLVDHADALGAHRIGMPLPVAQMRFARSNSAVSVAFGWLIHDAQTPGDSARRMSAGEYAVERWCADTAYPRQHAGRELLAADTLLAQVAGGDTAEIAALVGHAFPPIAPVGAHRPDR